jgi:transposase
LKVQLLIALYSVRSERQFCERLDYDLLFRFFLDMNLDDPSWDASVFTKNRDRLVHHEVARQLFEEVVRQAKEAELISAEHFTVDSLREPSVEGRLRAFLRALLRWSTVTQRDAPVAVR